MIFFSRDRNFVKISLLNHFFNFYLEFFISAAKWRSDEKQFQKFSEILMILSLVSEISAFIRWETVSLTATVRKPRIVQKHLFWSGYPYRIRRFKGTPTSHKIDDSQKCFSKWIIWRYLWLIRDLWFFHTKKSIQS